MRDRAWCVEHDRSAEFVADFPTQHRVCFSGLGSAETTCRIETAAGIPDYEFTHVPAGDWHSEKIRAGAAEARLAQIAHLAEQAESYCSRPNACGLDLNAILTVARGEEPA